ncbi:hypothetical protein CL616_02465 [archaeon]|nr:hypothetical protein [archaeon]
MRRELLLGLGLLCSCAHVRDFRENGSVDVVDSDAQGEYLLVRNGSYCSIVYEEFDSFRSRNLLYWESVGGDPLEILRLTREYCKDE